MKPLIIILSLIVIGINISCQQNQTTSTNSESNKNTEAQKAQCLTNKEAFASAPFITKDAKGNPVICWTERLPGEEKKSILKYAVSTDGGASFQKEITVTPSAGTKPHHESMNKVAFKKDNSVVAVYSLSPVNAPNRFASDIFYTISSNNGAAWSSPQKVHSDTTGSSYSFFDLAALPNGEVGCCWLNPSTDKGGRPVVFAQTNKTGFLKETTVDEVACQCCRTELFIDSHGNINIAYRDIINDSIRDMVVARSTDLGASFDKPERISEDNWVINGCPHTGPTMAFSEGKLHFAWFTVGGGAGLYYTQSADHGKTFAKRTLIDQSAKHPQMVSLNDNQLVLVWDEPYTEDDAAYGHIVLQTKKEGNTTPKQYLTVEKTKASFPVITAVDDEAVLVVWIQEEENTSAIYYKKIKLAKNIFS